MRKAVSVSIVTLLLLIFRIPNSDASSTVNIVSEGNASAKVDIQNNFNSTSTTNTNTSTSNTKVRIETNGEVKEYESSNGEDVNMESSDGSSKVTIKNNGGSVSITPKPTLKEDENATNEAKDKVMTLKEKQKDFFEKLGELIKNFFANLF
ncbi:MAG: hypothetical protein Q7T54_03235 [Candidatus Levybacteria bacterium]|nr:hypothetical protein [Candidatus Levybacteria bacterium]